MALNLCWAKDKRYAEEGDAKKRPRVEVGLVDTSGPTEIHFTFLLSLGKTDFHYMISTRKQIIQINGNQWIPRGRQ